MAIRGGGVVLRSFVLMRELTKLLIWVLSVLFSFLGSIVCDNFQSAKPIADITMVAGIMTIRNISQSIDTSDARKNSSP